MTEITTVSNQWRSRPADERFTSLYDMRDMKQQVQQMSRAVPAKLSSVVSTLKWDQQNDRIALYSTRNDKEYDLSNWSFGQLARQVGAPAGYLRELPADLAGECLNASASRNAVAEDTLLYLDDKQVKAFTSTTYGRIYDLDVINALIRLAGNGTGDTNWRVPGEFSKRAAVTRDNTTMYASDRDMFVFLADEDNRIEVPNNRYGADAPRTLARGFYISNSEVGASTLTIAGFLFDYVCANRIIWGVEQFKKVKIKHTKGAVWRFMNEVRPLLEDYRNQSQRVEVDRILDAQRNTACWDQPSYVEFGRKLGLTKTAAENSYQLYMRDEGSEPRSRWDVATAITGYAKHVQYQDERVKMETIAGGLLK